MYYLRRLPIPGLSNCRDLGGFACDGGVTRFGVFFRSEAPCGLTQEAVELVKKFGVREVFEFRGEEETLCRPNSLEEALPYRAFRLTGGAETFEKQNLPEGRFAWEKIYIKRAVEHRDWFRDVITACAEAEDGVLFNCTTGKDRTGIITCCLLSAVGVCADDIAADYCVSEVYLQKMFHGMRTGKIRTRRKPATYEPYVFHTPYRAMLRFIRYLEKNYGSVRGYLLDIGVTEQALDQLREKFVEPY